MCSLTLKAAIMWADNETDQDLLGFSIHADLLRSIITNPDMLPVTVGLFGDWGGGKSSILKILQRDLAEETDFAVIYFNGWVFEGYEDAKSAILSTLLRELMEHRDLRTLIGDEAKALLKRVNWMKLLKVGASAGMAYLTANPLPLLMASGLHPGGQSESDSPGTQKGSEMPDVNCNDILNNAEDTAHSVRSFRDDFQKLIEKTGLKSLVILIDDLDRCSPERLIENLEAIKLFLNVDRTAFVVATDRRIVENAIRLRYSELFTGEKTTSAGDALVTDYLEKLIQVPYTLPKLAPHEVRSYLCMLFLKKHLPEDLFKNVLNKYTTFLKNERYASFQLGDEISAIADESTRNVIGDSIRIVEACSDAITDGLKGNPRQIKRFLNAFWLRRELARVAGISHLKDHILIKIMVLEYMSDERFDDLYQWHRQSNDGTAPPLSNLEAEESIESIGKEFANWATPRLWRWLKAEPLLGKEDLRDYFWVSRSAITDTFAGVRLMTQAMRTCAEELLSNVDPERQSGVVMFSSLTEDEQEGVIGVVMRHAMQTPNEYTPLRSFMDLAKNGHLNAATALTRCITRIRAENLPGGFGIALKAFRSDSGNRAAEMVISVREQLSGTDTQVGRALKPKRKATR
jgi:hypothetical protein